MRLLAVLLPAVLLLSPGPARAEDPPVTEKRCRSCGCDMCDRYTYRRERVERWEERPYRVRPYRPRSEMCCTTRPYRPRYR